MRKAKRIHLLIRLAEAECETGLETGRINALRAIERIHELGGPMNPYQEERLTTVKGRIIE